MIFVSIAAYCDPLLQFTLDRALATAARPDDLHFGVVDQGEGSEARAPRLSYVRIDPAHARGPSWARAIAISLYRGEDWFLQIDSHMDFDERWDETLIAQARPKTVLTAYPAALTFENGNPVHADNSGAFVGTVRPDATFPVVMFQAHPRPVSAVVPAIHLGAGALFAPGGFVSHFPYDPYHYFHGEEQALFLRLYTHGWDIAHPMKMPIYHMYVTEKSRVMHWDRDPNWRTLEQYSRARVEALLAGADLGVYGLGKARSLADYAAFSGIDYERRTIAPRAYGKAEFSAPLRWSRWG